MYLENKGQDQSKEPLNQTNEDFVYNSVPRCIVDMDTIEVLEDQITSPYVRGNFDIEEGNDFEYHPENISLELKDFDVFFAKRRKLIRDKLKEIFEI